MKVKELIERLKRVIDMHKEVCFHDDYPERANKCTALEELTEIIRDNPVKVRPARKCPYPHFNPPALEVIRVPVKPPTWRNSDGEEVLISSMTPKHLQNTIDFVKRVRTDRGEAALGALEAEQRRRAQRVDEGCVDENEPPF
jgi:hypothetical protein